MNNKIDDETTQEEMVVLRLHDGQTVDLDHVSFGLYDGKCSLCKHFRPAYQRNADCHNGVLWIDAEGWCCRFPPVFVGGKFDDDDGECATSMFKQPGVNGHDECGEYKTGFELVA